MTLRAIEYRCDETVLQGYLADGSVDRAAPGVLVAHEAPGLNPHIKERAQALAELGYVALALDMYGEEDFPLEDAMTRHIELVSTPGLMLKRATAALETLLAQPRVDPDRIAAIGYCQGGMTALELARAGAPVRCAVGFHPGLLPAAGGSDRVIAARVLMMVGDQDPVVPPRDREAFAAEMTAKRADWQLHIFGGVGHTYSNPAVDALGRPGFAYDARADRRSWRMMLDLLEEEFATERARAA
jgi:dienelactone hydrolase